MICVLRGVGRMAAMETRAGHVDFFIRREVREQRGKRNCLSECLNIGLFAGIMMYVQTSQLIKSPPNKSVYRGEWGFNQPVVSD